MTRSNLRKRTMEPCAEQIFSIAQGVSLMHLLEFKLFHMQEAGKSAFSQEWRLRNWKTEVDVTLSFSFLYNCCVEDCLFMSVSYSSSLPPWDSMDTSTQEGDALSSHLKRQRWGAHCSRTANLPQADGECSFIRRRKTVPWKGLEKQHHKEHHSMICNITCSWLRCPSAPQTRDVTR